MPQKGIQGNQIEETTLDLTGVDGTGLTNVDAVSVAGLVVGTAANNIVQLDASARLPAVDGSLVTNVISYIITNAQIGTAYTLVLTDDSKMITMNNAAANTLTVPPNSSVIFPIGTQILVSQEGTGQTTIVPGVGVTLNSAGGLLSLASQYSTLTLVKKATDIWLVAGDLA